MNSPRFIQVALSLLMVTAMTACGGEKAATDKAASEAPAKAATDSAATQTAATTTFAPKGEETFMRCATCHQMTGAGVPGSYPPLAGSEWATAANAAAPIRILLKGLAGPITVKGQQFTSAMPAYGTGMEMSDAEVAAVLTYVRSSWGNTATAVTAEQVAKERATVASRTTPWAPSDLAPLIK